MKKLLILLLCICYLNIDAQPIQDSVTVDSIVVDMVQKPFLQTIIAPNKPPYVSYAMFGGCAILDAGMDAMFTHYSTSVFRHLNPNIWNPQVSWQNSKTVLGYHVDAWHVTKSVMILGLAGVVMAYHKPAHYKWWKEVLIYGVIWNTSFDLFYDVVLKRAK